MPVSTGIHWVKPPSDLAKAIEKYGDKVMTAVGALAEHTAREMQNDARRNVPWQDRTGNARSGLFGVTDKVSGVFHIILGHTMYYGVFLELSNGMKYAIIMPTIEGAVGELERQLKALLSG